MEKILENIKNGKYENKRPYPKKPEGYKKELYMYDVIYLLEIISRIKSTKSLAS